MFLKKGHSQEYIDYLKTNAIDILNRQDTNTKVFNAIKSYQAILIGEMHGTKEASEFLIGIVKTLLENNSKNIIVGLEIPNDLTDEILNAKDLQELSVTKYFNNNYQDGRQSRAYAELIIELKKLKDVKIIFFDISKEQTKLKNYNRDSLMYININNELIKYPNSILVTLSGSIHNRIKVIDDRKTMGCYLNTELDSKLRDGKIVSLNTLYGSGTMMNRMNDGFKLREVKGNAGYFDSEINYNNYLFIFDQREWLKGYNGILFTKIISASKPLIEDVGK